MYDDLIASLRTCIKCSSCKGCKFDEEVDESDLIGGELAEPDCMGRLMVEAADAIEELSRLHEAQRQNLIALMNEEPEPKWIPCSERLPEAGERVLCYCRANIYEVLKMRTSGDWFYDVHHIYMHDFVTHWMPLPPSPEPPKVEA